MWRFIDRHNESSLWGWCINQLWAMRGFVVPHINTLQGSSWTVGPIADLRCKQQAFSEDLGHCIRACLWLCGGEGDLWINPEFPRLSPRLLFSWGQLPGTWTKPRSCTSYGAFPAHMCCVQQERSPGCVTNRINSRWFAVALNATRFSCNNL